MRDTQELKSSEVLRLLQAYESRNVTLIVPDGSWPIVWDRAHDVKVWDLDGVEYTDLTAAFGVAATGHANDRVVQAGQRQMGRLLHAMGDVHPHAPKALLAAALSKLTFERWYGASGSTAGDDRSGGSTGKVIFCNAGFEAVEAALKTATLATGRPGVIAFEGAYHGLGYGTLNVTDRPQYRSYFSQQLANFGRFVPYPTLPEKLDELATSIRHLFRTEAIGAVLVEPIQGRGGIRVPPLTFLPMLRQICDEYSAVLIVDEIYTGFGRTGRWFASEHTGAVPDVVCLGKGLTGGFPLSACVGRSDLMDAAWPEATGDPIHTSTFLGHPVGCAMALAQIEEIESRGLVMHSEVLGRLVKAQLAGLVPPPHLRIETRSVGLMAGIELRTLDGRPDASAALRIVENMLRKGFIMLPDGVDANVVTVTPPLTITESELYRALTVLAEVLVTDAA
jgi:4-aminobutyrate aminotransferase-like enzyme